MVFFLFYFEDKLENDDVVKVMYRPIEVANNKLKRVVVKIMLLKLPQFSAITKKERKVSVAQRCTEQSRIALCELAKSRQNMFDAG